MSVACADMYAKPDGRRVASRVHGVAAMRYPPCAALLMFSHAAGANPYKEVAPLPGREEVTADKPTWCPPAPVTSNDRPKQDTVVEIHAVAGAK